MSSFISTTYNALRNGGGRLPIENYAPYNTTTDLNNGFPNATTEIILNITKTTLMNQLESKNNNISNSNSKTNSSLGTGISIYLCVILIGGSIIYTVLFLVLRRRTNHEGETIVQVVNYCHEQFLLDFDSYLDTTKVISCQAAENQIQTHKNLTHYVDNNEIASKTCSICLEPFKLNEQVSYSKSLQCDHVFHHKCLVPWLEKNFKCPYCRRDYNITNDLQRDDSVFCLHHGLVLKEYCCPSNEIHEENSTKETEDTCTF